MAAKSSERQHNIPFMAEKVRLQHTSNGFMAKLVRHLTSNEEIVSSNSAEGILFASPTRLLLRLCLPESELPWRAEAFS
ncbi:hypothetical protein QG37_02356 [Candidozyma auris]|nr:hypothetical protein QG37_02356 [[Candida] auris]